MAAPIIRLQTQKKNKSKRGDSTGYLLHSVNYDNWYQYFELANENFSSTRLETEYLKKKLFCSLTLSLSLFASDH